MRRIIYIFIFCISISVSALAQPRNNTGRQKIEAAKIAFITQRLDLTPDEAQQFWPLYNSYQKETEELIKQRNLARKQNNTDGEMGNELEFDSRMLDVRKRYNTQFGRVLPKNKATQVFKAEREFRQQLFKELGQRNGGNRVNKVN